MSEADSLLLRANEDTSISVIAIFPKIQNDTVSLVFNEEFNPDPKLPKFSIKIPSGSMDPGESWKETIMRRITKETGYTPEKMHLCLVAEYNSTTQKRHLKIFVAITKFFGVIKKSGCGNISRVWWENPKKLDTIATAQQLILFDCIAIIRELYSGELLRIAS